MYDRNFEPNIGSNDRTTIKNCPLCQGEIPQDAAKCMHCGEWVNKKEKNRDLEEASTKFCPFCDSEIHMKAVKCKHCGEWVEKKGNLSKIATETTESTVISEAVKEGIKHLKDIWR